VVKPPSQVPRVRDYLQLLTDGWIVIVCATALSAGGGWLARETTPATYQATTRVFVVTPGGAEVVDAYYGNISAEMRANTVQQLVRSSQVTKRTVDQLHLSETPQELAGRTTASAQKALVEIDVTGYDPELTRAAANGVTSNLIQLSREMSSLDTAAGDIVLVDAATGASNQRGSLSGVLLLGGSLGLALSMVLVIARGLAKDRVLSRNHVGHIADEAIVVGNG
jgi:capsular polysaccharide biosynthesis protein